MSNKSQQNRPHGGSKPQEDKYTPNPFKGGDGKGSTYSGFDGPPSKEGEVRVHIAIVGMRGLPKNSFSVIANPNEAALPASGPYPMLNKFNPVINAMFAGEDNLDGGNVQQYANSIRSKMLYYFDYARLKVKINYRYLPIAPVKPNEDGNLPKEYPGRALIDEMRKSIAESTSILSSTTFHLLAINNFAVITDMPMGSAKLTDISAERDGSVMAYTNVTDVLYAMSIYYQTLLQDINSTFLWHNAFRLKMGVMIRNAWDREVAALNALFGLFNKSSFLNLMKSISLSFEGEYFDKDFADQIADASFIPSRRSNSLTDPLMELQPMFSHPSVFKVVVLSGGRLATTVDGQLIYDDASMVFPNPLYTGSGSEPQSITIWEVTEKIRDYLSAQATALWGRRIYASGELFIGDTARFNVVQELFKRVTDAFTYFKPLWSDYRECLDTMSRTGTLTWRTHYVPQVTKENDSLTFRNMIINNIYQAVMGGPNKLEFSKETKRWRGWTKWNMYDGIPAYDVKQGGFFISVSCKDPVGDTDGEEIPYLPVAFSPWENKAGALFMTSRNGYEAAVSYEDTPIAETRVISRLAPLASQTNLVLRVPVLKYANNSDLTAGHQDTLYKTLCDMFGVAKIEYSETEADYAVDPDLLAVYQIEYEDITNVATAYARANAPFRGTTSEEGVLGFWGLDKRKNTDSN